MNEPRDERKTGLRTGGTRHEGEPYPDFESRLPRAVRTIARVLEEAGHRCWVVGGCVRDLLLDELRAAGDEHLDSDGARSGSPTPGDWDLATDARPEQVKALFRKVVPTGIEHGTVTVVINREHYEVTTLRGETTYTDGRRPDEVYYVDDLEEDLARRDFTVNAIAYDPRRRTLHDPFDGRKDLRAGLIRAVGNALDRFGEDGLRVLRCARFTSTLGLRVEETTRAAIRPSLDSFRKVALERVRDEWFKALTSERPSSCFEILRSEGLLAITAPSLFPQEDPEWDAPYARTLEALDSASPDPLFRLGVLCVGSEMTADAASQLASHLRLSSAARRRLERLVRHASPPRAPHDVDVRRWLAEAAPEFADDVLAFQAACARLRPDGKASTDAAEFAVRVREQLRSGAALQPGDLAVSGKDLIEAGMAPGPEVGRTLRALFDHVLENPEDNDRQKLLHLTRQKDDRH